MAGSASCQPQIESLRDKGYVVVPRFVPAEMLVAAQRSGEGAAGRTRRSSGIRGRSAVSGRSKVRSADGGTTVRRLLDAYNRDAVFAQCGTSAGVREWMEAYFGEGTLMSRAHHNCLMTKHPRYGSLTGWHRDIRYWSFEREDLVSAGLPWEKKKSKTVLCGSCRVHTAWHSMPIGTMRRSFSAPIERTMSRSSAPASRRRSHRAMRYFSTAKLCILPARISAMR